MNSTKLVFLALLLAGCNAASSSDTASSSLASKGPARSPQDKGSPVSRDEVLTPREKSGNVNAADYAAKEDPYRLFGIEAGDGRILRGATIANARDWTTRTYREGDLIGRGMRVAKIGDGEVTLESASGDIVLHTGKDVSLRVVRHRLDVVAEPLGRNFYAVDAAAARATDQRLPTFEQLDLYGGPVLKLGAVEPGTLFAAADFHTSDLVAAVDGQAVTSGSLVDIQRGLTDGRARLDVRVIRAGVPTELHYLAK